MNQEMCEKKGKIKGEESNGLLCMVPEPRSNDSGLWMNMGIS